MTHTIRRYTFSLAAATALAAGSAVAQPMVWDAAAEYSDTVNPNGVWSYGWSLNRGAPLNLYNHSNQAYCGALVGWSNQFPQFPAMTKNAGAATVCCSSVRLPPGGLAIHPGQAGENCVVRWTAPETGDYWVEVDFVGVDFTWPTNSDVAVLHDLSTLWSAELGSFEGPADCTSTGYSITASYRGELQLTIGDTVDANVGFGQNQRYNGDSTMVEIRIMRTTTVESVGVPCNGGTQLGANPPRLGLTTTVGVSQAVTGAPGALLLSAGPPVALPVFGCTLHTDPATPIGSVPISTSATGGWQISLPMPAATTFHGFQVTLQALIVNQPSPLVFGFSNGLLLTL